MPNQNPTFLPVLTSWAEAVSQGSAQPLVLSDGSFSAFGPAIILDSLEEGVVAIGLDKKILYMNRAAREILGMPEGDFAGMDCQKAMRTSVCSARCLLEKTIETGEPFRNYEITLFDHNRRTLPRGGPEIPWKILDINHLAGGQKHCMFHDILKFSDISRIGVVQ